MKGRDFGKKYDKEDFKNLIESMTSLGNLRYAFPYSFIERLNLEPDLLMGVLAETLEGRRVLVVSPFSKSIEMNFRNRASFFIN